MPRLQVVDSVDNSFVKTLPMPSEKYTKSPRKRQIIRRSFRQTNSTDRNKSLLVTFVDEITVKEIKRISRTDAKDVWYSAIDMDRFRLDILNCKYHRFENKLKSARCHNHMRRFLLHHRISKQITAGEKTSATRNSQHLSSISMKSSKKAKEAAIKNACRLEKEIIADESYMNTQISVCFGPSHRWVIDYYLWTIIDTLTATLSCGTELGMCGVSVKEERQRYIQQ